MDFGTLAVLVLESHAHRRWKSGGGVEDADCERGFAAGLRELQQGAGEQDGQEQADDCGIAHLRAVYIVHLGGDGPAKAGDATSFPEVLQVGHEWWGTDAGRQNKLVSRNTCRALVPDGNFAHGVNNRPMF